MMLSSYSESLKSVFINFVKKVCPKIGSLVDWLREMDCGRAWFSSAERFVSGCLEDLDSSRAFWVLTSSCVSPDFFTWSCGDCLSGDYNEVSLSI